MFETSILNYEDSEPPCDFDIGHEHTSLAEDSVKDVEVLGRDLQATNEEPSSVFDEYPGTGGLVQRYWPLDHQYHVGTVGNVNEDGTCLIQFDDNDVEGVNFANKTWNLDDTVNPHQFTFEKSLESNEQKVWLDMLKAFGNKLFLRNHAQAFDQSAMLNSYQ